MDIETIQFEAVKIAMKQTKDGFALTLALHPDEIPEALIRDFVGARYQCVLVRLDQTDRPIDRREFDGSKMVQKAGIMCREALFWELVYQKEGMVLRSEKEAAEWLCIHLNIESRSELKTNTEAQEEFKKILRAYEEWKKN